MTRVFTFAEKASDLVSSVVVDIRGAHAHISVWNRGAKAGELCVNARDWEAIASRLLGRSVMMGISKEVSDEPHVVAAREVPANMPPLDDDPHDGECG